MKQRTRIIIYSLTAMAYAVLFSLGVTTLVNFLGIGMGSVLELDSDFRYPRFYPFNIVLCVLCFAALAAVILFTFVKWEKLCYKRWICTLQAFCALLMSFPLVNIFRELIDHLHEIF